MHIGILALQGDIQAHALALSRLGVRSCEVREPAALEGLQGLVLPGGESTTMWHFLHEDGFAARLRQFARDGGALFGTCAGAILLARGIRDPDGTGLGIIDIAVQRNGYGRQIRSRIDQADADAPGPALEVVLIRAPRILRAGPLVRVRARLRGEPIWVEEARAMATTFHPELGDELRPHRRFLELAAAAPPFRCRPAPALRAT
jgi:5'-phosphate synthase pdxT subunit